MVELTIRDIVKEADPLLSEGIPMQWTGDQYDVDTRDTPEHWEFFQDDEEKFRVYSDGGIEAYGDQGISLEELEDRVLGGLAALRQAYRVKAMIEN